VDKNVFSSRLGRAADKLSCAQQAPDTVCITPWIGAAEFECEITDLRIVAKALRMINTQISSTASIIGLECSSHCAPKGQSN
jgi:hypothetical protein